MKLIACHIENFGKLSNFSVEFSSGINVINEANAWGKSTLAAFLKVMFYGFDSKKNAKAFEKERVLYRPWQGGIYGGEVDFEVDGRQYRISRTFGATEKTDQFHLYDLHTNLESTDYTSRIGEEIFDLDSTSFKRSIFIAQNDCVCDVSDGINAKLGNLAENTNDINNFDNASRKLKEILNQLTPDRVTGSIKKRKNYITQLSQELRGFSAAQDGLAGIKKKEQVVSEQIEELLQIRKNYASALVIASEDSRKQELYAQYDVLCKEVEEKEKKTQGFESYFPSGVPSAREFSEYIALSRKIEEINTILKGMELSEEEQQEWDTLHEMFEKELPSEENIDFSIEMLSEVDEQKKEIARQEAILQMVEEDLQKLEDTSYADGKGHKLFLWLGCGVILVGVLVFAAWYFHLLDSVDSRKMVIAALFTVLCGAVFSFIGAVMGYKNEKQRGNWMETQDIEKRAALTQKADVEEKIASLKEGVRHVHETIGTFLGKFRMYCVVGEYQSRLYELKNCLHTYERFKEQLIECAEEREEYQNLQKKLDAFAETYGFSFGEDKTAQISALQNKALEYKIAQEAYAEVCHKRESFEQRQEKSFWTKVAACPYSLEELNHMIEQADLKLEELKEARTQYAKQMEDLQEQLDLRDEKQIELEELLAQQEIDTRKYHIMKLTHDFLQCAKEQFTAKYMDPIAKGFSKYYKMLAGDVQANWMIDANIHVKIQEKGELRETKWLSAGYQDLIGFCMRLALVDAMYQEEKPFLILDDPFVNLDKEKVKSGNKLLLTVSKEYQVIYFTCHDSRSPM